LVRGPEKQKQVLGFAKDDRKKSKSKKQKQVLGFAKDDRKKSTKEGRRCRRVTSLK